MTSGMEVIFSLIDINGYKKILTLEISHPCLIEEAWNLKILDSTALNQRLRPQYLMLFILSDNIIPFIKKA